RLGHAATSSGALLAAERGEAYTTAGRKGAHMRPKTAPPHQFLVDAYHISVQVRPVQIQTCTVRHGKITRVITSCDNIAHVQRSVSFSRHNTLSAPFTLRYSTRNWGYISEPLLSAPNEAPPAERGRYDDYGTEVLFAFTPTAGKSYSMSFDVFK